MTCPTKVVNKDMVHGRTDERTNRRMNQWMQRRTKNRTLILHRATASCDKSLDTYLSRPPYGSSHSQQVLFSPHSAHRISPRSHPEMSLPPYCHDSADQTPRYPSRQRNRSYLHVFVFCHWQEPASSPLHWKESKGLLYEMEQVHANYTLLYLAEFYIRRSKQP